MITFTQSLDAREILLYKTWGGADAIIRECINSECFDDLAEVAEECFEDLTPSLTEINDFVWFELENLAEMYKDEDARYNRIYDALN